MNVTTSHLVYLQTKLRSSLSCFLQLEDMHNSKFRKSSIIYTSVCFILLRLWQALSATGEVVHQKEQEVARFSTSQNDVQTFKKPHVFSTVSHLSYKGSTMHETLLGLQWLKWKGFWQKDWTFIFFVLGFMSKAQLGILRLPRMEAACEFPSSFPRAEALNFKSPTSPLPPFFFSKNIKHTDCDARMTDLKSLLHHLLAVVLQANYLAIQCLASSFEHGHKIALIS